ncbi:MAG: PIN domain-containing protein [Dehalococcoidia bacterium]|nr:PIN domain-containing protein [Dehalococcoidia bacterium]
MTLVVDASVVIAAFTNDGPDGRWAERQLLNDHLVAPHLLPAEVANTLRRQVLRGATSPSAAALAHADLLALTIELFSYEPFAQRVWELRGNITAYDAWYVALAEFLNTPLATLDRKLAAAPGPRCTFATPVH